MSSSFGDSSEVSLLSAEELRAREEQMLRNRDSSRFLLLRQGTALPESDFEQRYLDVYKELCRREALATT